MNNPDVLFIHPGAQHGIFGQLGDELTALEPPPWTRMIAGYIRDRGWKIAIIDAEAERFSPFTVANIGYAVRPKLICITVFGHQPSASTQQMVGASEIAREFKKICDIPIIMVGAHPTALPERTLREEAIDYVGIGEGPLTIEAMLKQSFLGPGSVISNIETIPGLVFRFRDEIRQNEPAPLIEDMSKLHGDVWNELPMHLYRAHLWQCLGDISQRQPYASIYTSLGCPYKCSFCMINVPFKSNRYRMRHPEDVVAQIERLHTEHGISTLKIADEMFVLKPKHYMAICEGLVERGLGDKLNIWAYARVDTVKPETLTVLRQAGIRWLALGIESGSKHVRDGAEKALRTEDIVGVVRTIQEHDINVIGNFMFGLRDDTEETMLQTLDLAVECMPDFANFYSCMAYPGSALYDEALLKGWTLPESWRAFSQHNSDCRPLDTEHVSGADVLAFRDSAFEYFFTHPKYIEHVLAKFGAEAVESIKSMTTYKLPRKLLAAA